MEKLFYQDQEIKKFTATVTDCAQTDKGWEVTLDATAFYPTGGGQACDLGMLGDANVLDVSERGEEILHLCDAPLEVGKTVTGKIDWARRFDRKWIRSTRSFRLHQRPSRQLYRRHRSSPIHF